MAKVPKSMLIGMLVMVLSGVGMVYTIRQFPPPDDASPTLSYCFNLLILIGMLVMSLGWRQDMLAKIDHKPHWIGILGYVLVSGGVAIVMLASTTRFWNIQSPRSIFDSLFLGGAAIGSVGVIVMAWDAGKILSMRKRKNVH